MSRFRPASVVVLLSAVASALLLSGSAPGTRDDDFYLMRKNFEIFGAAYAELVTTYHQRVDPERFMRTGLDAMLSTLDPWTDFFDEADNVEMDLRGRRLLADVGLALSRRDGRVTVIQPEFETTAYRQGIRTGDVVLRVAGQPVDSLSIPDVLQLLRGEPATVVVVDIERAGEGTMTFSLRREAPEQKSVPFAGRLPEDPAVVVLRLAVFGQGAAGELAKAWQELSASGPVTGVILDLRGNPGGLVSEAVEVAGLFLPKGTPVVSTRGRSSGMTRVFRSEANPVIPSVPTVVLMDRASASASEIVAGALQDFDRAVIIGEPSFGKGLVQSVYELPYNTSLKVTMSAYYTPSGRGIFRRSSGQEAVPAGSEFRTAAGRVVREGFGIEPDLAASAYGSAPAEAGARPGPGPLEAALERDAAFFLFAGVLATDGGLREAWSRAQRPLLPDDVLPRFRTWLQERKFSFRTPFEESLESLASDGLGPESRTALERLRRAAASERDLAFDREADRLRVRLSEEVSARLLGPEERVRAGLTGDPFVTSAIEILRDPARHQRLLAPR